MFNIRRFSPHALACSMLLVGCHAPGSTTHVATPGGAISGQGSGALVTKGGSGLIPKGGSLITQDGGGLITQDGGGLITQDGGTLVAPSSSGLVSADGVSGLVSAPAGIVAAGGGNLITQDGGTLISQDGGGVVAAGGGNALATGHGYRALASLRYSLQALNAQKTLVGAHVAAFDAAGIALKGADGKPLVAITDAKGRYTFKSGLPKRGFRLMVDLGVNGQLQAIAPKGRPNTDVSLDLVSTLTSSYIVEQFVKGQSDPQATLDRLSPDVEQQTRIKTSAALVAGGTAPTSVTTKDLVTAVTALRAADPVLDGQLDTVRKLLIAVGQSDLGNGLPGVEIDLPSVRSLYAAADGSLLIDAPDDHRVWRLRADGIMETVAGTAAASGEQDVAGKAGPDAALWGPDRMTLDGQGRVLLLSGDSVLRLGADKRIESVASGFSAPLALFGTQTSDVLAIFTSPDAPGSALYKLVANAAPSRLGSIPAAQSSICQGASAIGRDTTGRLYFCVARAADTTSKPNYEVWRANPTAQTFELVATTAPALTPAKTLYGVTVDPNGNVLVVDAQHALVAIAPDGTTRTLVTQVTKDFSLLGDAAAIAPDGTTYVAQSTMIMQVKNGKLEHVAGSHGGIDGPASRVSLQGPKGLALAANGDIYVTEADSERVDVFPAGAHGRVFAGANEPGSSGNGGPAVAATLLTPTAVRVDAQNNVYLLEDDNHEIRKVDNQGKIQSYYKVPAPYSVSDFVAYPDGTLAMLQEGKLIKRLADGTQTVLADLAAHSATMIGLAPNGDLYMTGGGAIERISQAGGTLEKLGDDNGEDTLMASEGGVAVSAAGIVYIANADNNEIMRFDPATKALTVIAGDNGKVFHGAHVDDSIGTPYFPAISPITGELLFSDTSHKQIKRIPKASL